MATGAAKWFLFPCDATLPDHPGAAGCQLAKLNTCFDFYLVWKHENSTVEFPKLLSGFHMVGQQGDFFYRLMDTQVWSGRFWMGRFNSLSPKPHVMYSNDKEMILLLCRKAGYMSREEAQKCPVRTSRTYLDSRGQKRCVGRKKELRESQSPA